MSFHPGSGNTMVKSRKKSSQERGLFYTLVTSVIMLLYLFSSKALARDLIRPGDILGLDECTGIALKCHPGIAGAAGSLKASMSRTHEAKSSYYPQVSAKSSYTREHPLTVSEREEATANHFSNTLDVSQTLMDFGRTTALAEARSFTEESYRMDLQDVTREIIFKVKKSYFGVLQAKQSRDAYSDEVSQLKLHLDQARRFHEVGLKAKIDVTNAEVNLGQARLNLLNAENGLRLARLGLNNAMGLP
ncbi:TolC family protein, partial [archaeon]|nr:TolC family protein [archaeon]